MVLQITPHHIIPDHAGVTFVNHNQAWTMFLEALAARDKPMMRQAMEIMAATTFRRIL